MDHTRTNNILNSSLSWLHSEKSRLLPRRLKKRTANVPLIRSIRSIQYSGVGPSYRKTKIALRASSIVLPASSSKTPRLHHFYAERPPTPPPPQRKEGGINASLIFLYKTGSIPAAINNNDNKETLCSAHLPPKTLGLCYHIQ